MMEFLPGFPVAIGCKAGVNVTIGERNMHIAKRAGRSSQEPNKNILKLWLEFVKTDDHPWVESGGHHSCYFCGETFPEHKDDCIHKLTKEYLNPTTEESV